MECNEHLFLWEFLYKLVWYNVDNLVVAPDDVFKSNDMPKRLRANKRLLNSKYLRLKTYYTPRNN